MLIEGFDSVGQKQRGVQVSPDGAAHFIDGVWNVPAFDVPPIVDGSATHIVRVDAGASNLLTGMRIAIQPGDLVNAGDRLTNGAQPDTRVGFPGGPPVLIPPLYNSAGQHIPLTELYVAFTCTGAASAVRGSIRIPGEGSDISSVGCISDIESDASVVRTAMLKLDFSAATTGRAFLQMGTAFDTSRYGIVTFGGAVYE